MGTRERREREKEELKQKILNSARELFTEDGYKNVTMRKIADKIEYSLPTIYEHFKNKADILLAIYYQSGQILFETLKFIYERDINPLEKIEAMGRAYISIGLENRDLYELTFLTNSIRTESANEYKLCEIYDSPAFKAYNLLVQVVNDAKEKGYFSGRDVLLISQTMWAGLHGLVSLIITNPEFPFVNQEQLIDGIITRFGLKVRVASMLA
jgi:AcrR family transcriptional regulator